GAVTLVTTAVRITFVRLLTTAAALGTTIFSRPGVQEELEAGGEEALLSAQKAFFEFEGVVTEVESEAGSIWSSYDQMRGYLQQLYTRLQGRNPPNIEFHHLVEQGSAFAKNAINSMANVVPTPIAVHRAISAF